MKLIPLTKGYSAKVDDEWFDYLSQWKWHYNGGYAERKEYKDGKQIHIQMHHVVSGIPHDVLVDHRDTDKMNNQFDNLRPSNHSKNAMNMRKHKGSSVYKGVCKEGDFWRIQIWKDNEKVFSAIAKNEQHAAMIYDLNASALFGEYARLNFPNALLRDLTAGESPALPLSP